MPKRELTNSETIEILFHAIRSSDPRDTKAFIRRVWDSLGYEGHEAIRRSFTEINWETEDSLCNSPEGCGEEKCQACCAHDDWDHDQCLYCEKERDPGIAIDRAMDRLEDR